MAKMTESKKNGRKYLNLSRSDLSPACTALYDKIDAAKKALSHAYIEEAKKAGLKEELVFVFTKWGGMSVTVGREQASAVAADKVDWPKMAAFLKG